MNMTPMVTKNTMKTPIQKLIEELEMMRDESDGHTAEVEAYTKAIELANYFLDEEVDALDDAYSQGVLDEYNNTITTSKK
jgi:hypothetical protein